MIQSLDNLPSIPCGRRGQRGKIRTAQASRSGVTMLGVTVYAALLTVFGGMLASLVLVSSRSTTEHDTINRLGERNRISLFRVSEDVRSAIASTAAVQNKGLTLAFTLPANLNGTTVVPGPTIQYRLEIVPEETNNGTDDNGNGLVDEGQLVRRNQATGDTHTICQGLDLGASNFTKNGDAVIVTLANTGHLLQADDSFDVARSLTIRPRN